MPVFRALVLMMLAVLGTAQSVRAEERITDWKGTSVALLQEGDVMSDGVKIHYHTVGEGPLLVLIHGIGGFWFDWRHQIPSLSKRSKVVAMTQRGFNRSGQPAGAEQYTAAKIAGDIDALIKHFGRDKATIMAFDSSSFHSSSCAMHYPQKTERFVAIGRCSPGDPGAGVTPPIPRSRAPASTRAISRNSLMPRRSWPGG